MERLTSEDYQLGVVSAPASLAPPPVPCSLVLLAPGPAPDDTYRATEKIKEFRHRIDHTTRERKSTINKSSKDTPTTKEKSIPISSSSFVGDGELEQFGEEAKKRSHGSSPG